MLALLCNTLAGALAGGAVSFFFWRIKYKRMRRDQAEDARRERLREELKTTDEQAADTIRQIKRLLQKDPGRIEPSTVLRLKHEWLKALERARPDLSEQQAESLGALMEACWGANPRENPEATLQALESLRDFLSGLWRV